MIDNTYLSAFFIESGNLIIAESFERISMYRGAMEPTWTKGGAPGVGSGRERISVFGLVCV